MRRPVIAGNWKMNLNGVQAEALASVIAQAADTSQVDVVLCPPAVYLQRVHHVVQTLRPNRPGMGIGAQNVYFQKNGAYTGEVSVEMLVDLNLTHVILGHSERRQLLGETDEGVNRKLVAVLESPLLPIVCVGETLEEREQGRTGEVVQRQFEAAFSGVSATSARRVILAYEPVWAIGTGKTATPEQAQEVHGDLRKLLEKHYNFELSQSVRILYGGSVKAENAAELLSQRDIDGALVGGASLQAETFLKILAAAQ